MALDQLDTADNKSPEGLDRVREDTGKSLVQELLDELKGSSTKAEAGAREHVIQDGQLDLGEDDLYSSIFDTDPLEGAHRVPIKPGESEEGPDVRPPDLASGMPSADLPLPDEGFYIPPEQGQDIDPGFYLPPEAQSDIPNVNIDPSLWREGSLTAGDLPGAEPAIARIGDMPVAEPAGAGDLPASTLERKAGVPDESLAPTEAGADVRRGGSGRGDGIAFAPVDVSAPDGPRAVSPSYRGEVIHRDVEPSVHTAARGETLTRIAREHLGTGATREEIDKHAREIAEINHLGNPPRIAEGTLLTLPGHTSDGAFVTADSYGRTRSVNSDGSIRLDHGDGTGYVREPDGEGGTWESHFGPDAEDNYAIRKTVDGRYLIADRPGDVPTERMEGEDPRVEAARLNDLAESKITDPEALARFQENMREFERRAEERGLPPEEIARTYREIGRLLEAEDNPNIPLTAEDRIRLAEQVMDQAAHPTHIDQGFHDTCNVTTVESRTYTTHPAEAARLVADVATTGEYRTNTTPPVVVTVNPESLIPDPESEIHPPTGDSRSHASQIFQVTAVNIHYTMENNRSDPPGRISYEQVEPVPGSTPPDDGERLLDRSTDPPTELARDPELDDDHIVDIANAITGENSSDVMIAHPDTIAGEGNKVTRVNSEAELNESVARLAREGKLPVIIGVYGTSEPFLTDSGGGRAGGSDGAHVVTITGYRPGPPPMVEVDNQWGEEADHTGDRAVSMHDLYLSMRPPDNAGQIADMRRDVEWNREHNSIDTFKEFELLRMERVAELERLRAARRDGSMTEEEARAAAERSGRDFDTAL
ncbi:MAG TPA: LysM domain-containing protein, partial [Candidatus Obscuribacterales bacterium]